MKGKNLNQTADGGHSAPAGYDRRVTHLRGVFGGNLLQSTPANAGAVSFTTRIR